MEQFPLYAAVSCKQKMATAAYGSENDIMVLTQTQLDLPNKVIKVLEPIEEITKSVSEE